MHASRALKCSKRLENHPGRGAIPCDNIYIVARSTACCSRACVRMVGQSGNDFRHGNPRRTYAPNNDTPRHQNITTKPNHRPTNPRHRDTLTARRAGLALAALRLPLAARHRKRGRKLNTDNHLMIIYISLYIQSLNYYTGGVGGFRLSVLPGFGRDFGRGFRVCPRAYRRRLSGRVIGFAVAAERTAGGSAAGSPSAVGAWVRGCVGAVLCRASRRSRGGAWFVHFDGAKNHLKNFFLLLSAVLLFCMP